LVTDSGGLPVHFELSGGQKHDVSFSEALVTTSRQAEYVVADKGYDSELIECTGAEHVFPRRGNSRIGNNDIDWHLY
jgi:hypothetical protein